MANLIGIRAAVPDTLKGRDRAEEKIATDYNGDATQLKDVLRASLVADSLAQADAALTALREVFPVALEKNSFGPQRPVDGYRDAKVFVRVGDITAEVQVHLAPIEAVKELVHKDYEEKQKIIRKYLPETHLSPEDEAEVARLNEKMSAVYSPAWDKAQSSKKVSLLTDIPLRKALSKGKARFTGSNAQQPTDPSTSPMAMGMSSTSRNSTVLPSTDGNEAIADSPLDTGNNSTRFSLKRALTDVPTAEAHKFVVPETPTYLSQPALLDLSYLDTKPVRLPVGRHDDKYGLMHILGNWAENKNRAWDSLTDDDAENVARGLVNMMADRETINGFESGRRLTLAFKLRNKAIVLENRGDHWSIVTVLPTADSKNWGVPTWRGRLTFPSQAAADSASPGAALPGVAGQRRVLDEQGVTSERIKYNIGQKPVLPKVTVKKTRMLVRPPQASMKRSTVPQYQGGYYIPETSDTFHRFVTDFIDEFDSLKLAVAAGKPVADDVNPATLQTLFKGRAGALLEDLHDEHIVPLLKHLVDNNLSMEDAQEFLHARHAPEANARMRKINQARAAAGQNVDALSGMSDTDAAAIVAAATPAMVEVGKRIDALTKMRRELLVSSGIMSQDMIDAWEGAYKHYVPLFRDQGDETSPMPAKGKGFSVKPKDKRRAGSEKDVVDIIPHVIAQLEATIIMAEKNAVGQSLVDFAEANPNENLWRVDPMDSKPVYDAQGLVTFRPNKAFVLAPNVLSVRVKGVERLLVFNENDVHGVRLAEAMKQLNPDQGGWLVGGLTRINQYLSQVYTGMNPEFTITNFFRDIQTAAINLTATAADEAKFRILRDVPKAMNGIRSALFGDSKHPWAAEYKAFRDIGGKTGFIEAYRDIKDRRTKLEHELFLMQSGGGLGKVSWRGFLRGGTALIDWVQNANTVIENGVRLSAFVHAKQLGLSDHAAAKLARQLTVDFNQRGKHGKTLSAFYLFFNPAIQGSTVIVKTLKRSAKARAYVAAIVAFHVMLDMLNRAMGEDDEEPYYDQMNSSVKDRNIVVMWPDGSGRATTIPMPYGYNAFGILGQEIGAALMKPDYSASASAVRVMMGFVQGYMPITGGTPLQTISPTVLDPLVQYGENKTAFGSPLYPDYAEHDFPKPMSTKFFPSVREPSKRVAAWLNDVTGGDELEPGSVDVSPEFLDSLWDTATGGLGRVIADSFNSPAKALRGEDVEVKEVPFLRKVLQAPGVKRHQGLYYERRERLNLLKERMDIAENSDDPAQAEALVAKYGPAVDFVSDGHMEVVDATLAGLRKEKKEVDGLPDGPEKEAELKRIETEKLAAFEEFNDAYVSLVSKQGGNP
jgi:hypothetical protein